MSMQWERPDVIGIVVLICYGVIAGSAFLFTSYTSQDIPPITLCALRLLIGFVGLFTLTLLLDRESLASLLRTKQFYIVSLVMGVFNNFIPYSLYPYAYYLGVDVGISSIFSGLTPLFALLFAIIFLPKLRPALCHPLNFLGVIIGIFGIVIVSMSEIAEPDFSSEIFLGYIVLIVYACSKAFASVFGSVYIVPYHIITIAAGQTFFGFLLGALFSLSVDFWFPPPGYSNHYQFFFSTTWQVWVGVFYLGLGPSLLCYIMQFYLLKHVGSLKQITVDFITPIVGIVEGALFAGDWSGQNALFITGEIVGSLVLGTGVMFVHMGKSAKMNKREEEIIAIN